jgi:hypothetical protein
MVNDERDKDSTGNSSKKLIIDTLTESISNPENSNSNSNENIAAQSGDLARLFLKLKTQHFVPESVIQSIYEEMENIDENIRKTVTQKIEKVCADNDHLKKELEEEFQEVGCLSASEKLKLKTKFRRGKTYRSSPAYIKPQEVVLGRNNLHQTCKYYYVPVADSIKSFLSDSSVKTSTGHFGQDQILSDYKDGTLFEENHSDIEIFLFQDAFEVCVCVGSAKKKYKMLGVYYVFAHLDKYNRYLVDNIQLVLMCRNVHVRRFGIAKVFERLVAELSILEHNGILLNGVQRNVRLSGTIGDNLGQHELGGLCENFSTNTFPCRFCYTTMNNLKSDDHKVKALRTPQSHTKDVRILNEQQSANHKGLKSNSCLNNLSKFHAFRPGMAPCVAHDIFEGVLKYDLILIIHHFSEIHEYFYEFLNMSLKSLSKQLGLGISFPDVGPKTKKLPGKAFENWYFLILLPFVFKNLEIDHDSAVWQMFYHLSEIVKFVTAHDISKNQVMYLSELIDTYFFYRKQAFPLSKIRPKHHYMAHYPSLILLLGPLRIWWALRFEAKHQYFKQCLKAAKCFINPAKTIAESHQLYQSTLFGSRSTATMNIIFFEEDLGLESKRARIEFQPPEMYESSTLSATLNNITYKVGNHVLLSEQEKVISVLNITKVFVASRAQKLMLCGSVTEMCFNYKTCLFESFESEKTSTMVDQTNLLLKNPLKVLKENGKMYLSLESSFLNYAIPTLIN